MKDYFIAQTMWMELFIYLYSRIALLKKEIAFWGSFNLE